MEANNGNVKFEREGAVEEDDQEILKRRISSHPLYGLLTQTHLNCLKVGLGETGEVATTNAENQANLTLRAPIPTSPELDQFMEAYCLTLSKLKEAMEKPVQETTSFIEAMYIQLEELAESHPDNYDPKPKS